MGGSTKVPSSTTSTVTQKNEPPAWLAPYAQNMLATSWGMAQQPYQQYPGLTVAPLSPQQQAAMMMGTQYGTSDIWDTVGQINQNPYLDEQIRLAQHEVMPDIGYMAKSSGSFGNSGINEAAAKQFGDIAQNMRFANYSQALNLAPQYRQQGWQDIQHMAGIGDMARAYQQELLDEQRGNWEAALQWPYSQMDWAANILRGAGFGTYGQSSGTSTEPNPYQQSSLANLIGGGMALGGLYDVLTR